MEKRIKVLLKRPNPLFEKWIEELLISQDNVGSKRQNQLRTALNSLKRYPLVLESGSECAILNGFGKTLCSILDKRITEHQAFAPFQNVDLNSVESSTESRLKSSVELLQNTTAKKKRRLPEKEKNHVMTPKKIKGAYVPKYRSGAYAILIALYKKDIQAGYQCYMFKDELVSEAQKYCDESMSKSKPGSHYTSWSCMKLLVSRELVSKERTKKMKYQLTESGCDLAKQLLLNTDKTEEDDLSQKIGSPIKITNVELDKKVSNADKYLEYLKMKYSFLEATTEYKEIVNTAPVVINDIRKENTYNINKADYSILFAPDTFDIILLVDKQEISGALKKDDATIRELEKYQMIKYELRHLKVGDFTWVARRRADGQELVLPHIVERKRMDDLGGSIKDGRFHEQKFRLKQCGIPNLVYLVESHGDNQRTGLPLSTLMQAVTNTRIQDGFMTHFTSSLSSSIKFLAMMTGNLAKIYKMKTLISSESNSKFIGNMESDNLTLVTFNLFNTMASKTKVLSVKDMFIKQLLQLKGISVEKAVAIASLYQTPLNLMNIYKSMTADQKPELLLAKIQNGGTRTNIGSAVSKSIFQYFTSEKLT